MAKAQVKPNISGGRTLSKMYRSAKAGGGSPTKHKRAVWFQLDGRKYGDRGKLGSY